MKLQVNLTLYHSEYVDKVDIEKDGFFFFGTY